MKFKNRTSEINFLKGLKKGIRVAVIGRRRIGKTTLVEHVFGKRCLTLFIPAEKTEQEMITDWAMEHTDIYLPKVRTFREFFEYLFSKEKRVIFLDEMQNMLKVNKSFIYDLQHLLDKHKKANVVVSGSYISMMKKLVENYKSPIYGRFDFIIKLKEFDFAAVLEICREFGYTTEDAINFYSVFGGIPKYYEILEKLNFPEFENVVKQLFFIYPRPLNEETRTMLKEEFGKEHKMFFSILSAIASGKCSMKEISDYAGVPQTNLTKYIKLLKDDFEIISREIPATEKKSKKGVYILKDAIFYFWFYFVWRNYCLLERNEDEMLAEKFMLEKEQYMGKRFELLCREALNTMNKKNMLPFCFEKTGCQWGKIPKTKETYEIDIVALNEKTKEILFAECKWKKNADSGIIYKKLNDKAKFVSWEKENRKEYYAIFSRSFSKRITAKNLLLFDIGDFEKIFKG